MAQAMNALRNGNQLRIKLGELPKPLTRVKSFVRQYRAYLERACLERHGEISNVAAHLIDEAATAEQHAGICRWLLNKRLDTMAAADIRECSAAIVKAKAARNRAVLALDLDAPVDSHPLANLTVLPPDAAADEQSHSAECCDSGPGADAADATPDALNETLIQDTALPEEQRETRAPNNVTKYNLGTSDD